MPLSFTLPANRALDEKYEMEFYGIDFRTTAVLVTLKTTLALFSIWLGMSSLPWFSRGMIALAVIALLIPPRAYEPAIAMFIQVTVVAGTVGLAKRWHGRKAAGRFRQWRFQLADLFRGIFILALGLTLMLYLVRQPRTCEIIWLCLESLLQAVMTLLIVVIVLVPLRVLVRIPLVIPLVVCWFAVSLVEFRVTTGNGEQWEMYSTDVEFMKILLPSFLLRNGLLAAAQFVILIALLHSLKRSNETAHGRLRRAIGVFGRLLLVGSGVGSAALILSLWWKMTFRPTPPQIVIPHPNGYDDACSAAKLIQGDSDIDPDAVTMEELAGFVRANERGIAMTRTAMQKGWQRPLTFTGNSHDSFFTDMQDLRALLRTLNISVRLAIKERRLDDAVNDASVGLRLGSRIRNGGHNTDFLVGIGFEYAAMRSLKPARTDLDAEQCRRMIATLQTVERERLPANKIEEFDRIWTLYNGSYQYALLDAIGVQIGLGASGLQSTALAGDAEMRLFAVDLAIRAYRLERGHFPRTLDELVPEYFAELPRDPFTERSLIYRRKSSDEFALYAAGPDGDDDGGKSMSWEAANTRGNGDFFVDW